MSDNRAETMADTVHERVGKLEQETHTIKYQLGELRQLPPRVSSLERDFSVMTANVIEIKASLATLQESTNAIKTTQDKTTGALEALPKYIKLTLFVISIASLAGILSLWAQ